MPIFGLILYPKKQVVKPVSFGHWINPPIIYLTFQRFQEGVDLRFHEIFTILWKKKYNDKIGHIIILRENHVFIS